MLTDDDLTRQLRDAFDVETRDMTYDRAVPRTRPRPAWVRPGLLTVPAVGVAAAAVLVLGAVDDPTVPTSPGTAPSALPTTATTPPTAADGTISEEIALAGMTFTYERGLDEEPLGMLAVFEPGALPSWASEVTLDQGYAAKVWVGQDPESGRATMFVDSPDRWGGALTGLASPDLSVAELEQVARTGTLS